MIVIGAKGFAKQLIEAIDILSYGNNLLFYDDVNATEELFLDKFKILHNEEKVQEYFTKVSNEFALGIGGTFIRKILSEKFSALGGKLCSVISPYSHIANYEVKIGNGVTILHGVIIENSVEIGNGTLLNLQSIVCHDSIIAEYTEISPGVKITGKCQIGSNCSIGSGAILLPGVKVGDNVIIGAGAVVTKNIESNRKVIGIPARYI